MVPRFLLNARCHRTGHIVVAVLIAIVLSLVSCPNPIPIDLSQQMSDTTGPQITIDSPDDGDTYQSLVTIRGSVQDAEGSVSSLQLRAPVLDLVETIDIEADGTFAHTLGTVGTTTSLTTTLTATDWNGNVTSVTLTLENDLAGPFVLITEPTDYSAYSTVVRVSGIVTDAEGSSTTQEVSSCSYRLPGTSLAGDLDLSDDCSFAFEFATRLPDGTRVLTAPTAVEVSAEDWNGNISTASVTIVPPSSGDVNGLTATPGNKQGEISWESVQHATSYTIHNPRYGEIRENVASGYVWDGLINGEWYGFQVQAVVPDEVGEDAWSDVIEVMPLSERTLAPRVTEIGFRLITIEWGGTDPPSEYIVERREGSGPWLIWTRTADTSLTDSGLTHDTTYSYRVSPADQPDTTSASISAVPGRFPDDHAERAAIVQTSNDCLSVGFKSPYAYAGIAGPDPGSFGKMEVFDCTDPYAPIFVTSFFVPGPFPEDIVIQDSCAYVLYGDLRVYDITVGAAPGFAFQRSMDLAHGAAIADGYLYVAESEWSFSNDDWIGVEIFDLASPPSPAFVGRYDLAWNPSPPPDYPVTWAEHVAVAGDYAYVANQNNLLVIDVSSKASPSYVAHDSTPNNARGVDVEGNFVYVADTDFGLHIYDVSTPSSPSVIGSWQAWGDTSDVIVRDSIVYLADGDQGLKIIDVATPATPVLIDQVPTAGTSMDIALADDLVLVADGGAGFRIIDIGTPDTLAGAGAQATSWAEDVAISDGYAFVADSNNGLYIIDISDPESLPLPVTIDTGNSQGVAVAGERAYVAGGVLNNLVIVDVTVPADPAVLSSCLTGATAMSVAVSGSFAYVGTDSGIEVIDITNPRFPEPYGRSASPTQAIDVEVSGSYAYVAAINEMAILDVTDPAAPYQVGSWPFDTDRAVSVSLFGTHAAVATEEAGLQIVDVSDPTSPVVIGTHATASKAYDVSVVGRYAYVALQTGIQVFDVSDPTAPTEVGYDPTGAAWSVTVAGSYAFVACASAGLRAIRLVEP